MSTDPALVSRGRRAAALRQHCAPTWSQRKWGRWRALAVGPGP
ncbi:MAG: hypothetical protein AAGF11_03920 [Myxococcota bacterium]